MKLASAGGGTKSSHIDFGGGSAAAKKAKSQAHDIPTEVFGRAYLEVRAGYFTH
jgi:hypothetical protein